MTPSKDAPIVRKMFSSIAENYDAANTTLSFGLHKYWKSKFINQFKQNQSGIALDLCTGTGDLAPLLEATGFKCVQADFCLEMLQKGQSRGVLKTPLQADALNLPFADNVFDLVTVAFGVRNFENLISGLKEIARVTKSGGEVGILEFGSPPPGFFSRFFRIYSDHVMPFLGGLLTGNKAAYEYLPATSKEFPSGQAFTNIVESVGLKTVSMAIYTFGACYSYRFRKS